MNDNKKVIINTEVTGLYPKDGHKLVEIAAIEIGENDIQTGAIFHAYINPKCKISKKITALTGLNNKFLKNCPTFEKYKEEFLNFIDGKEIIGLHVQLDMDFLSTEIGFNLPNKITDILEIANAVFPKQVNNFKSLKEQLRIKIKNSPYNGALLDSLYILEIYKKLKEKGSIVTEEKLLPLHQAILDNDVDTFAKLISETDDVKSLINKKDSKGRSAIFFAAKNGHLECFKRIHNLGATLDYVNNETGDTLLHVAFAYGGHKLLNYLIDVCHMDINAIGGDNMTILGVAMMFLDIDEACYLISKGAKNVGDIQHLNSLIEYLPIEIKRLKFKVKYFSQYEGERKAHLKTIDALKKFVSDNSLS